MELEEGKKSSSTDDLQFQALRLFKQLMNNRSCVDAMIDNEVVNNLALCSGSRFSNGPFIPLLDPLGLFSPSLLPPVLPASHLSFFQ